MNSWHSHEPEPANADDRFHTNARPTFSSPGRHDQDDPIDVYLSPQSSGSYERIHCLHCGMIIATLRARIVRVMDTHNLEIMQIGVGGMCRRCKARYRFVLV